jgi:dihydrofolate reductase
MTKVSLIAALSENRSIGKDNKLLWHIPEDLKRFRQITQGHPVIMGRITFESIGRPLQKRLNIVITRDSSKKYQGVLVVDSIEKAIFLAKEKDKGEIFVIGGGEIYKQAINYADKLYLTIVHINIKGDAFFPDYSEFKKVVSKTDGQTENLKYTFLDLER